MKVVVTGSHGFIGTEVVKVLSTHGHEVIRLSRKPTPSAKGDIYWDPENKKIAKEAIEGAQGVVHLAGENIASGRWTSEKKEKIWKSRVDATRFLCETLAGFTTKPEVIISASAIGFYGNRGDEILTEKSEKGQGFLADLCAAWEEATKPATDAGIRVVLARIGVVLGRGGGALKKMLLPFKLGMGGPIGSGRQVMSWIAVEDVAHGIEHCLRMVNMKGPVNFVSPHPVTNKAFSRKLGCALYRPALVPFPSFLARATFGDLADEVLLSSEKVMPTVLNQFSYNFKHQDLKWALEAIVK